MVQLVRQLRQEAGITQAELAERLGVDQSLVSKVECKERRLDVAELRRVCHALGTTLVTFARRFERALQQGEG
ncbi:MAG: helix-turn-helix transcriptional regulator [Planctomycetes bacterium]|nr:helix-turn-helix transcriptional regulator [Planctomycetota bacterium]